MKTPVPSRRAVVVLAWIVGLVVLLVGLWLVQKVVTLSDAVGDANQRAVAADKDRVDLREELDGTGAILTTQQGVLDELQRRCRDATGCTPVTLPPLIQGIPGAVGAQGIAGPAGPRGPRGPQGPKGDQGDTGSTGTDGASGSDGKPGETGAQGTPGADGKDGRDGADGKDGAPGRGVQSIDCVDGQLVTTYTDGTNQPVAGSSCVTTPATPGGTP